ncbi:hemolysin activator protein [Methylophaga lonarensis MPL]|uniref:Hemolysin activator protein n=1 Tax=Methylophaga lonarensis MPL TaxID=1286106 RepID=M7P007_9GAMM|nr:ShlB/FhaC/HecB family hemolysin secretion/activation protein [Methylophaga lonarensis]EMR12802.1 hemolysin activator protein [Methylophaga lonarensis MPL]
MDYRHGRRPRYFSIAVSVIWSLYALASHADVAVIDRAAQEQQLQQERERQLRNQQEISPDVRIPTPDSLPENLVYPDSESPCFPINSITLVGESSAEFQFALSSVMDGEASAIDRCLGAQGINVVMSLIQNAIIARGYVTTRVLAAPQDLNSGALTLTVIPGKVRKIQFAEGVTKRATRWNAIPIKRGDILNLRDIEQGLENFKRVPTVDVDIQIEPAEGPEAQPGESDVLIQYQQRFPFRVTFSADDAGFDSTGKYQGGVTVSGDNLLMLNDLFYMNYNRDLGGGESGKRGSDGQTIHYSLPFGYWLFSTTASSYDYYQAVSGINQSYVYSGRSKTSDIKASRLIYRDAINKTYVSLRGFFRKSSNYIDDTEIEVQRRRTAGWELGFSQTWYLGRSVLDYNLAFKRGTGAFNALRAPEEAFGEGTSRMEILTADLAFNLPFNISLPWGEQALYYSSKLRAQYNFTPLTAQDRFSIGNRYTVRGFDGQWSLSADRGWFVRNELSALIYQSGQAVYVGLDYGEVSGPSSHLLLGRQLAGAVVGLRGGYGGFSYDVFVGQALKKPKGFQTASTTTGFNLNLTF